MSNEIELGICTLKKIRFFKDLEFYNISLDYLIDKVQMKYNLSKEESELYIYKKATSYMDVEKISQKDLLDYILCKRKP